jgi:zinc ribbon protein
MLQYKNEVEPMYCPKCATQNNDDTKFCRSCGANLSLVPQALSGQLAEPEMSRHERRHRRRRGGQASLSEGITKIFMGAGFFVVAFVLMLIMRQSWGVWMLIPSFGLLGKGVAEVVSAKQAGLLAASESPIISPPPQHTGEVRARNTGELLPPPPSVTEGTTRHLDPTADRRPGPR